MGDDGFGREVNLERDQVGWRPDLHAAGVETEEASAAERGGFQRQLDIGVAAECASVCQMHRAFEHVAAAVGASQVADAIVAACNRDAGGPELFRLFTNEGVVAV